MFIGKDHLCKSLLVSVAVVTLWLLSCSVCKSMKSWLDSDPRHVAVVHCKVGEGGEGREEWCDAC